MKGNLYNSTLRQYGETKLCACPTRYLKLKRDNENGQKGRVE